MAFRQTYQRDPAGIADALARLRATKTETPAPEDLAWQDSLPELPEDEDEDAVLVEIFEE